MANQEGDNEPTIVVGRRPVFELIRDAAREVDKVLIKQGTGGGVIADIRRMAHERGIQVQFVPASRLDRLAGGAGHQGVAAFSAPIPYLDLHELLQDAAPDLDTTRQTKPVLLLLDGIQDPHNFGAILRTAAATGVNGVVVPRHGMAPLGAVTVKASAGTAGRVPIARVGNLADTLYPLKERGFWILGASGEGAESVWDVDVDRPLAIVIGSEGSGLGKRIAGECDHLVQIPMRGDVESLNASVAAGVILFIATRTRLG